MLQFMVNNGKYTSPMDGMGINYEYKPSFANPNNPCMVYLPQFKPNVGKHTINTWILWGLKAPNPSPSLQSFFRHHGAIRKRPAG